MSKPSSICRNCGNDVSDHHLANFADGAHIGANFMVCPESTFQPANKDLRGADDDSYCHCNNEPDEEESASNVCKSCGKLLS